jgi:hypothetical protein
MARLHGLLDLARTDDVDQLHRRITAAGGLDVMFTQPRTPPTPARSTGSTPCGSAATRWTY